MVRRDPWLVPTPATPLPAGLPTTYDDHADTTPPLPVADHPIPTRRYPLPWTHRGLPPDRTSPARPQLESPNRHQIHRTPISTRTSFLQPWLHPEEITPTPSGRSLADDGRRDRQRSPNGSNGRPIHSTNMVGRPSCRTTHTRTHQTSQTTATPNTSDSRRLQYPPDRLRRSAQST